MRSGNRTSNLLNKDRPLGDCAILASYTLLRSLVVILDRGIRASGTDFDSITYVNILRVKRPLTESTWQSLNLSPFYLISYEYCAASLPLRTTTRRRLRRPKNFPKG